MKALRKDLTEKISEMLKGHFLPQGVQCKLLEGEVWGAQLHTRGHLEATLGKFVKTGNEKGHAFILFIDCILCWKILWARPS